MLDEEELDEEELFSVPEDPVAEFPPPPPQATIATLSSAKSAEARTCFTRIIIPLMRPDRTAGRLTQINRAEILHLKDRCHSIASLW
jgi:hypothetical protein